MAKGKSSEDAAFLVESSLNILNSTMKESLDPEYMESGNIGLDLALTNGRGIPIGSSVLLWADPGCGKSTVLGDMSRRLLESHKKAGVPFKVLYLATEGSRQLMYDIGLRPYFESKDFIYIERTLCWRNVEQFYNAILSGENEILKDVKLVIIDSVNNVQSDANMGKSVADGDFGSKAKERTNFYSKYFAMCKERGITTFLIAQVRQNLEAGQMAIDKRKAAASWSDKHSVDIILKCSAVLSSADTKKVERVTAYGKTTELAGYVFKMNSNGSGCKNRFYKGSPAEIYIEMGKGADNAYAMRKLLEFNKILKVGGGWYSFSEDVAKPLGISAKNMRKEEAMDTIREHMGDFVTLLKEMGRYNLIPEGDLNSRVVEGADGEDTDE